MSSSTNNLLISILSRLRISPRPPSTLPSEPRRRLGGAEARNQACFAHHQPSSDPDASAAAGSAEASSNDGDLLGCDGIIRRVSSAQMTRSSTSATTPGLRTTMVCFNDDHSGEGEQEPPVSDGHEQDHDDNPDPVGAMADELVEDGATGAREGSSFLMQVYYDLLREALEADNGHEQANHDPDQVDALADDDELQLEDGTGVAAEHEGSDFPTRIIHEFLLQELEPEEIEQLHEPAEMGQVLDDELVATFAGRIRQAISDGSLRVPFVHQATPTTAGSGDDHAYPNGGFGGVPASAAAIADLEKQKYYASTEDDGEGCVICIVDYEDGDELSVMPCTNRHRFHDKCLAEWLARSHLCPLCRHALPTTVYEEVHEDHDEVQDRDTFGLYLY